MNPTRQTVKDKMLESVLLDEKLMKFGGYSASDIDCIEVALDSDNPIVRAVATIIERYHNGGGVNDIYKEVSDYLKKTL